MENDKKNGIVYADHYQLINGELKQAPVIDYQLGSVRDDFDFGSILFIVIHDLHHAFQGIQSQF